MAAPCNANLCHFALLCIFFFSLLRAQWLKLETMPFVVRSSQDKGSELFRDALSIRMRVFVQEQGVPVSIEQDDHNPSDVHFVLYEEDNPQQQQQQQQKSCPVAAARLRVVTHCGIHAYDAPVAKVERVCVLKPYRGKQCGVLLMRAVEKYAREKMGISKLVLHSQTSVKNFYKNIGYYETSGEFIKANMLHLAMSNM
ncbi:actyltransferase-like protein [Trypanosoma rangeli]|uniref:Actyltransferase-like protein n=1 Tax=Trypanosoma rangeli TaxID=5698 RepID=A0A3R7ML04_TRYRA|nr:actyltransferase-like protein [Trypanosoma rangeli]RNF07775.1 actyltransferase-like protein [Trypanosoma rangeli]|eukprot:RNF07775.1 actyltransferase-like protein [Trypanosoma rangeli]